MASVLTRLVCVALVTSLLVFYLLAGGSSDPSELDKREVRDWAKVDLLARDLPSDIKERVSGVRIEESHHDIHGANTFTQVASPPAGVPGSGLTVLLLHGAAFTSQTWVDSVDTLRTLAALGHQVIAIDLPGYGKTQVSDHKMAGDKAGYMESAISALSPASQPVVVSPSMSGSFVIPLLVRDQTAAPVRAWVPVAPVSTSQGRAVFPDLSLPTMIVFGERDTGLGHRSRDDLSLLPSATQPQVLPGAGHPAYLDQPQLWHKLLHNFLVTLQQRG